MTIESYPPIVHVGELDAEAPERWRRFHQEACTGELRSAEFMSICNDESFAALRRADIGS